MKEWKGGDCPLAPGEPYEARHRDGTMIEGEKPELDIWSWTGNPWDIVAYRERGTSSHPSIRTAAALIGKAPSTLQRWKRTNPELYRAVMDYAAKRGGSDMQRRTREDYLRVAAEIKEEWDPENYRRVKAQRDQLREALDRAAADLAMIARVENNYLARSAVDRCLAALKATEEGGDGPREAHQSIEEGAIRIS